MRLRIADPVAVVVDCPVSAIRAEDASGGFGILPGHADFVTALDVCLVSWRDHRDVPCHCALRGGILIVSDGASVSIATREAHVDADLERLEQRVIAAYRRRYDRERTGRLASARIHARAIGRIAETLRGGPERPRV